MSEFQPTTDDVELLQQKLEFAEFEWNRATEGMKERDETIAALKARITEQEAAERERIEAYEATLGQRTYNEVAEHIKYLEARDAILDRCSAKVDCICRGEAMKQKDGSSEAVNSSAALVKALEDISEFCSGDGRSLGAVLRLAEVQRIANAALKEIPNV